MTSPANDNDNNGAAFPARQKFLHLQKVVQKELRHLLITRDRLLQADLLSPT